MKNAFIGGLVVAVVVLGFVVLTGDNDSTETNQNSTNQSTQTDDSTVVSSKATSLANQGLESLTAEYFNDNTSVTELDLSGNNLTGALPAEIRKMTKLEVLDASDNNLTGIPAEIGQLSKIRIIDFSNNDISGLPLEMGNLSSLETLDLRGNPNLSTYDLGLIRQNIPNAQILTDN